MRRLRHAHNVLATEIHDLRAKIPILVRSIWGNHSEAILEKVRQRQASVSRLLRQWEDAEHRLIAVANSLTTLKTGQRLVAVGIPLAAAHILFPPDTASCYFQGDTLLQGSSFYTHKYPIHAMHAGHGQELREALNRVYSRIAEEVTLLARAGFLLWLFLPLLVASPLLSFSPHTSFRDAWLNLMRWTINRAGPAFIKWGQWAATRPDMFPRDVCLILSELQTKAPAHNYIQSRKAVEAAFNMPLNELFTSFDEAPVASGSVAQVHRAVLTAKGAELATFGRRRSKSKRFSQGSTVAVKVRHPGVDLTMERDFALMNRAAALLGAIPGWSLGTQLKESLMQFGAPLKEQLDLRAEAAALAQFANNFRWWWGVQFPMPAAPAMVSSTVLVETFEEGEHISKYVGTEYPFNKRLADLGMNCYFKMLLRDNFIHADLHPGNILVQLDGSNTSESNSNEWGLEALKKALGLGTSFPRLVLLDVGMTARLSREDQSNLTNFFKSLTSMDGAAVADSVMKFSEAQAQDPDGFRNEMKLLFSSLDPDSLRLHTQEVMRDMMDTVRRHGLHMKGVVSTVVFSTMVLEGWSTKLDPDIRIMETLKSVLPSGWSDRLGKSVDRVMSTALYMVA